MIPKGSKKVARGQLAKRAPPLDQRKHPSRSRSHPGGMQEAENGSTFTPDSRTLLAYLRHATLGKRSCVSIPGAASASQTCPWLPSLIPSGSWPRLDWLS
jgi:hypothetical protein